MNMTRAHLVFFRRRHVDAALFTPRHVGAVPADVSVPDEDRHLHLGGTPAAAYLINVAATLVVDVFGVHHQRGDRPFNSFYKHCFAADYLLRSTLSFRGTLADRGHDAPRATHRFYARRCYRGVAVVDNQSAITAGLLAVAEAGEAER